MDFLRIYTNLLTDPVRVLSTRVAVSIARQLLATNSLCPHLVIFELICQIKLFPVFFVSIRSCPECERLWPPTDCQGVGLVYRPLWNCMGDDALNGTALSTPVLWYIQVQFTASCLRWAGPRLWRHFLNWFPREEKIAGPLLNLLPCSLVIFTWSYEKTVVPAVLLFFASSPQKQLSELSVYIISPW